MNIAPIILFAADAAEKAGDSAGTPLLQDTSTWVSLGFLVVVGLFAYLGVHKQIAQTLDKRAQGISDELDEARRLREEAQELLAQYQRRQREAEEEAQAVAEIRNETVDTAIEATRSIIRDRMDQSAHSALAEKAVDELRSRLN